MSELRNYLKEKEKELFEKKKDAAEAANVSQGYYAHMMGESSNLNTKPPLSFLIKLIEGWNLNILEVLRQAEIISNKSINSFTNNHIEFLNTKNYHLLDILLFHGNPIDAFDDLILVDSMHVKTRYKHCYGLQVSHIESQNIYTNSEILIVDKLDINKIKNEDICIFYCKNENKIKYYITSKEENLGVVFINRHKTTDCLSFFNNKIKSHLYLGVVRHIFMDI